MVAVLSNDNYPVKVSISVTTESLDRQAYQRACFICEANSELTGTFVVRSLSDILTLGFETNSTAYGFGEVFFKQNPKMDSLYLYLKPSGESYIQAFEASKKSSYLFVAIDSKDSQDILDFSERMEVERKAFVVSHGDPVLGTQLSNRRNTIFIIVDDETPQISCDGATDVFSIEWSYSKEDFTVPLESEVRLFNGSSDIPAPFGFEYLGTDQDVEPPYDYKDNYRVSEGFRFEFKLLPENQDQYYMKFGGDNPTIVQLGSNHWGVCLAPTIEEDIDMGNTIIFARDTNDFIPYELISLVYVDNVLIFDRANPETPYSSVNAFGSVGIAQVGINSEGAGGSLTALRNMSPQDKQVKITLAMNPEYYGDNTESFRHEAGIPLLHTDPLLNTNMSFTTTYNPVTQADYEVNFKLKATPAPVIADVPVGVPSPLYRVGLKNVDYLSDEKFIIQVYASDFVAEQDSYLYRDGFRLLLSNNNVLPQDGIDYSLKNDYRFNMQNYYAVGEEPVVVGDSYISNGMIVELPYLQNADYVLKVTRLAKPWTGAVEFDQDYEYVQSLDDPAALAEYGSPKLSGAIFNGNVMTIKINKDINLN